MIKTAEFHRMRKFGKKNRFVMSGSFTVEATLLMTILIPVLAALIYAAFYVHDSALLQGIVCELAAEGSNLSLEKDRAGELEKMKKELLSSRFADAQKISVSVETEKNAVSVSGSSEFYFPGIIMHFFGGNKKDISKCWRREILHPADMIRKIRGLEYVVNTIKE